MNAPFALNRRRSSATARLPHPFLCHSPRSRVARCRSSPATSRHTDAQRLAANQRRRHRHADGRQGRARPGHPHRRRPDLRRRARRRHGASKDHLRRHRLVPNEGTTAGSQSMPGCAPAVQQASAEVRHILLDLAAAKLGQPVRGLKVDDGTITAPSGAKRHLLGARHRQGARAGSDRHGAAEGRPPSTATSASRSARRHPGQDDGRADLPPGVSRRRAWSTGGRAPADLRGPARRTSTRTGRDDARRAQGRAQRQLPRRHRRARGAGRSPRPRPWTARRNGRSRDRLPGHEGIYDWLLAAKTEDKEIHRQGARGGRRAGQGDRGDLSSAPTRCTAPSAPPPRSRRWATTARSPIQTHSQSVFETAEAIAKMLGMARTRSAASTCRARAATATTWPTTPPPTRRCSPSPCRAGPSPPYTTRDDEHRWEPYGSAMVIKTRAAVDAAGNILDWNLELWSTPARHPSGRRAGQPAVGALPREAVQAAGAAQRRPAELRRRPQRHRALRLPRPAGGDAFHHRDAAAGLLDPRASAPTRTCSPSSPSSTSSPRGGRRPARLPAALPQGPRARDVLTKAAETVRLGPLTRSKADRGRGIAFAQYKNYAALLRGRDGGRGQPRTAPSGSCASAAADDSGHMVSPDGIANQIEGGVIQSLSWSLKEEVKFDETRCCRRTGRAIRSSPSRRCRPWTSC